ncbi:MAG: PrgI family protein [Phascolarctobacterium sp.]|nr:PrgI family protein [Phascolarctobacterium sp.]
MVKRMAYVSIPKDLTKVKNKVAFNLTKQQLICLAVAGALGLPFYFLTRTHIGTSSAATGMVLLMLPEFLFAMYEKDGMPLEKILMNVISVRFRRPAIRRYETENIYDEPKQKPVAVQKTKKGGNVRGRKKQT